MPEERFFLYRHTNGSEHLKKYSSDGDIDEMLSSDFVETVFELSEAQWREFRRPATGEEKLGVKLADNAVAAHQVLPGGIIAKLK